jgi:sortase (surface protein transpeptidase)
MRLHLPARPTAVLLAALATSVLAAPGHAAPAGAAPTRLSIPRIGVDAAIESVGLDADGAMDVPSTWRNVAWFKLGVPPGTRGNAVIAGHLDTHTGAPAVFWSLGDLNVGDDVYVTSGAGNKLHFRVSDVERYSTGTTPMDLVFGSAAIPRLNLITCTGTWNRDVQLYDHRLVVFTELVGDEGGAAAAGPANAAGPGDSGAGGSAGTGAAVQARPARAGADLPTAAPPHGAAARTLSEAAPTRPPDAAAGTGGVRTPACLPSAVPCRPERM